MKKHAKLYITIAVILLLAVGIYALFRGDTKRMNAAAGSGNPAMEFDNIDLKEDKDGKPVWRFKAKHVTMSQDKNIIEMTGVDGSFMKDDNEIDLTADKIGRASCRERV